MSVPAPAPAPSSTDADSSPSSSSSSAAAAAAATTSGSKRALPDAAAEAERRVQPRHSHSGPQSAAAAVAADSAETAAASIGRDMQTHTAAAIGPPPVARLYRHALESIFAFLDRGDLASALRVSRGWLGAVQSMGWLHFSVVQPTAPLDVVARSAMGRHIVALLPDKGWPQRFLLLSADLLHTLALRMSHLRDLTCELALLPLPSAGAALAFPAALRQLHIKLSETAGAADINAAVRAVGWLPLLEELTISMPQAPVDPLVSFAPLAALRHLRGFILQPPDYGLAFQLSDAHVDELRAMPWLRKLDVSRITTGVLRRLLQAPHSLQWQDLSLPSNFLLDDQTTALLPQLPSLTQLDSLPTTCARFEWLRGLPNLTHVSLMQVDPAAAGSVQSLVAGLQNCANITHLRLYDFKELTAAQLGELLPRLPHLRELGLVDLPVDSLSFLAQKPMTSQLTKLTLFCCKHLPLVEMRHVHSLRGLERLVLCYSFMARLDERSRAQYEPPSLLLPQLKSFTYRL